MRKIIRTVVFALMILALTGVAFANGSQEGSSNGSGSTQSRDVKLTYVNWEEGVAWTHFFQAVLEDEMGYNVTITAADVGPAFAAVSAGDQDFFMEAWLPGLHAPYYEKGDFEDVSTIYKGGVTGLIVPQYMADDGVTKLSDLRKPEVAEKLDYKITGIDAGAGMMIKTQDELIPAYGLDDMGYELVPSSSPAMLAAMDAAIQDNKYIVGMGWQPHSMFGRWPLVILQQDEEQIFPIDDIKILGRPGATEDFPEVAKFFDNVMWNNDTIGSLMVYIGDHSDLDTLEAARQWKDANPDVWQSWIPSM